MFPLFKKVIPILIFPCFLCVGCHSATVKLDPPPIKSDNQREMEDVWDTSSVDVSHVHTDKKLVALTFDDAPTAQLASLLEIFIHFNKAHPDCPASATLFCNGRGLTNRHKESLYTAFALGMELGNHSFSHHDLTTLSEAEIRLEIERVDTLLQEIDGKPLHLFRPPYGRIDEKVVSQVQVPIINWYVDTRDWAEKSAERLVERSFERLHDGTILLMHDGYESTVTGVKQLLNQLYEAGYQAVSVSQMAKAHGCQLKTQKVYTRARKQYK